MAILSKLCKPDNFEWHNSIKLGFTNIRDFRTNFFDCQSLIDKEGLLFAQHRLPFALHL